MIAVGLHLMQDARRDDAPGRSAVAMTAPDMRLSGVTLCRTDAEIVAAIGDDAAGEEVAALVAAEPGA
ncbi:MAG: hypothetical protein ACPGRF_05245, partial [Miltoncostaeaceae bacterium]